MEQCCTKPSPSAKTCASFDKELQFDEDSSGRWRKPASLQPIDTTRAAGNGEEEIAQEEEPLSPAARLFHEPKLNVYIIAIMGCKTRIDPDININKANTYLILCLSTSLL
jgi:hypothetical protein